MTQDEAPQWIAAVAAREGLDLADLKSKSTTDVRAWRTRGATARRPAPAARSSRPSSRYPANPLVDRLRAARPALAQMALRDGDAPTMFTSGDLPPFTASGNDPAHLAQLPPRLRHAAAKADQAEWSRLVNTYGGRDVSDAELIYEPAADDDGWHDYEARVQAWAAGRY